MTHRQDSGRKRGQQGAAQSTAAALVASARRARSLEEAFELYGQAVTAGEREVGGHKFLEWRGHFWSVPQTRPYMSAREGLVRCLRDLGRTVEATEHCLEMLDLNPDDHQGMRYVLASLLLQSEQHAELELLLGCYPADDSAHWDYAHALLAYRQEEASPRAQQLLKQAIAGNPHVPGYLLGHQRLPDAMPSYFSRGDENEAACFAWENRRVWLDTPGAITWLRGSVNLPLPPPPVPPRPSWPATRSVLRELPQVAAEVWQVDAVPSDRGSRGKGRPPCPWVVLIVDRDSRDVVCMEAVNQRPQPGVIWERVVTAMRRPRDTDPHRPTRIEVRQKTLAKAWTGKLQQIGIECVWLESLEAITAVTDDLPQDSDVGIEAVAGDVPVAVTDLQTLPIEPGDVWQADMRRMPAWITGVGGPMRAWVALVVSHTDDIVLATNLAADRPGWDWLWEAVEIAMRRPASGAAHRPGRIEVASTAQRDALLPHATGLGIACAVVEELETFDAAFKNLAQFMGGQHASPSLLEVPGITVAQLANLYAAAADFYRSKPWRKVTGDRPIRIECDKFTSGPWFAVVMGQSGIQQGLALYDDEEPLRRTICGDEGDAATARRMSALSLLYSEAFEIPVFELDAIEKHGWPLGGPEAYPLIYFVNPGLATRLPLLWELELLEGCLRAIPQFLADKITSLTAAVPAGTGALTLRLAWVEWA